VVVLAAGRVIASGPSADILARFDLLPQSERNEGGAVIDAVVERQDLDGLTILASPAGPWRLPAFAAPGGSRVRLRVRARDVMIATERPRGISALNILEGTVTGIQPGGDAEALVTIEVGVPILAQVTAYSVAALGLSIGSRVFAVIKAVSPERGTAIPVVQVSR
jgi:molybdate transport system ATP-binding protein